jgi:ABC-type antimicrobial peptide transport system permease subunit
LGVPNRPYRDKKVVSVFVRFSAASSVVPLIAVAAVILGRFIRKYSKMFKIKLPKQVVVEETIQGISIELSPMNGTEIARYNGKSKRSR